MQEISINFGKDGNAKSFIGDGWSIQEANHIWTIGKVSTLKVAELPRTHDLQLIMVVEGCRFPPDNLAQKLEVVVKNTSIKKFEVGPSTEVEYRINKSFIGSDGTIKFTFRHQGCLRPLDFGLGDDRPLAICFYNILITQVKADQKRHEEVHSAPETRRKNQNKIISEKL